MCAVLGLSVLLCNILGVMPRRKHTIALLVKLVKSSRKSAPELWEALRRKDEVNKILECAHPGSDLLLAVVESYKQVDYSEIRRLLLSLVASKVTYTALAAHILTRYEFSAARQYMLEVGAGLPVQPVAKKIRKSRLCQVRSLPRLYHFFNIMQDLPFGRKTLVNIKLRHEDQHSQCDKDIAAISPDQAV